MISYIRENRGLTSRCLVSIILYSIFAFPLHAQVDTSSVTWNLENLDQIGGCPVIKYGDPLVIPTPTGTAIYFSGSSITCDGLLIESNPLDNATEFTLEALIRVDTSTSLKQKYIHIENPDNSYSQKRRILMEYEKASDSTWFFHGYVAVGSTNYTLASPSYPHPYNQWHYLAIVYKDSIVKSYVNGIEELSGSFVFLPITGGHISIGRRMNNEVNSWFKGAIQTIRFTPQALPPSELLAPHMTGVDKSTLNVHNFRLFQNYPNPFNPTTEIRFEMRDWGLVTLKIFNILGCEVATLVNEIKPAGSYQIPWNATGMASGVYFYRLQAGTFIETKKMLVVK